MINNKVLLTAAGPNMLPLLEKYSLPTFKRYAEQFGYDIKVERLNSDSLERKASQAKDARWQKISLIERCLDRYETVLWLDADTLIMRFDADIAELLEPDAFQGLVLHDVPAERRINPNTGVWVVRSSPATAAFLNELHTIGMPDGRWADQGAVLRALEWQLGDDRYFGAQIPATHNDYFRHTTWLPIGWNQPYTDNRPNPEAYIGRPLVADPHIVHFMAMTIEDRLQYMPMQLDQVYA